MIRNQATRRENSVELREYLTSREYEAKVLLVTHVPLRALTLIIETRVVLYSRTPATVYQHPSSYANKKRNAICIPLTSRLFINRPPISALLLPARYRRQKMKYLLQKARWSLIIIHSSDAPLDRIACDGRRLIFARVSSTLPIIIRPQRRRG